MTNQPKLLAYAAVSTHQIYQECGRLFFQTYDPESCVSSFCVIEETQVRLGHKKVVPRVKKQYTTYKTSNQVYILLRFLQKSSLPAHMLKFGILRVWNTDRIGRSSPHRPKRCSV